MGTLLGLILFIATPPNWWEYPFVPFTRPEDARVAAKLQRRLEQKGGVARAIHQVCVGGLDTSGVENLVAKNFLIEQADRTVRLLLDATAESTKRSNPGASEECRAAEGWVVRSAICFGYDIGGTGPTFDANPLAVERRGRAQRALVKALDGQGRRADAAMELLLQRSGVCIGLEETVRLATPALIKRLGVPRPPLLVPRGDHGQGDWALALEALSLGGADRAIAETPVAMFLADDASAPLAALALARMDADASAAVPRLAHIVDGISLDDIPPAARRQDRLTQLSQTITALTAIGQPARAALPNVAAFVSRVEMPGCHTLGAATYVSLVRSVATAADGDRAAACLAPLLACAGSPSEVLRALGELGGERARAPLLAALRDETGSIGFRLEAFKDLGTAGQAMLGEPDRKLVKLLQAKLQTHPELLASFKVSISAGTAAELGRCRAEAGLGRAPPSDANVSWSFANCLSNYLCGPSRETYERTMERCCRANYSAVPASFCPGSPDAGSTGAPLP